MDNHHLMSYNDTLSLRLFSKYMGTTNARGGTTFTIRGAKAPTNFKIFL